MRLRSSELVLVAGMIAQAATWGLSTPALALGEQAQTYCDAAEASDKTSDAEQTMTYVYAGAAAACGYSCAVSWTPGAPAAEGFCTVGSGAAIVADIVTTKNFTGAMTGLMTMGMGAMMTGGKGMLSFGSLGGAGAASSSTVGATSAAGQAVNNGAVAASQPINMPAPVEKVDLAPLPTEPQALTGPPTGAEVGSTAGTGGTTSANAQGAAADKSHMSCLSAAMHGMQAMMKNQGASSGKEAAEKNRKSAETLGRNCALKGAGTSGQLAQNIAGGTAVSADSGTSVVSGIGGQTKASSEACSAAAKTGDFQSTVQCAVANGVPAGMLDPNKIAKATGMSPDDFFRKVRDQGPSKAIADAISGSSGLSVADTAKMEDLFKSMEAKLGSVGDTGTAYASSGGGDAGGKGKGDPSLDKMMAELMKGLMPQEEKPQGDGQSAAQAGPKRFPASVAEDRKVSIFERISNRYTAVSPRVLSAARAALPAAPADLPVPGVMRK